MEALRARINDIRARITLLEQELKPLEDEHSRLLDEKRQTEINWTTKDSFKITASMFAVQPSPAHHAQPVYRKLRAAVKKYLELGGTPPLCHQTALLYDDGQVHCGLFNQVEEAFSFLKSLDIPPYTLMRFKEFPARIGDDVSRETMGGYAF
jgi:hypothetical protein